MSDLLPTVKKLAPQKVAKATKLAQKIASQIDKSEMIKKVAEELELPEDQAIQYIADTQLDEQVHDYLVKSLSSGAVAVKAMAALNKLAEQGNLRAIELILGFNKSLVSKNEKAINNLHLHNNTSTTNIFAQLDAEAKRNLGEE